VKGAKKAVAILRLRVSRGASERRAALAAGHGAADHRFIAFRSRDGVVDHYTTRRPRVRDQREQGDRAGAASPKSATTTGPETPTPIARHSSRRRVRWWWGSWSQA